MRKMLAAVAVAGAIALAAPLSAQEGEAHETAVEHEAAGHEGEGIINWWSWDYGNYCKDGAHKHRPPPFGFALINFAIFLAIMSRLAWKPLKQYVRERHDSIANNLHEA